MDAILETDNTVSGNYVRESLAYIRFAATTIYYLPRDEAERRAFVRLANKAGFEPVEKPANVTGPEGFTRTVKRAKVLPRSNRPVVKS